MLYKNANENKQKHIRIHISRLGFSNPPLASGSLWREGERIKGYPYHYTSRFLAKQQPVLTLKRARMYIIRVLKATQDHHPAVVMPNYKASLLQYLEFHIYEGHSVSQ